MQIKSYKAIKFCDGYMVNMVCQDDNDKIKQISFITEAKGHSKIFRIALKLIKEQSW